MVTGIYKTGENIVSMGCRSGGWIKYLLPAALPAMLTKTAWAAAATTAAAQSENCKQYVGLTNRLSNCIHDSINTGAATFFAEIYPMLQFTIGAVMTLAMIVYGIMLAYGMIERVGRDTMLLLLKIAAVVAFSSNSPLLYRMAIDSMDSVAQAAVSYVPASGVAANAGTDFGQNQCMRNMAAQQAENSDGHKPVTGPWLGIDCLLDTVIGIKVSNSDPKDAVKSFNEALDPDKVGMARGLIFLFFSGLESSVFGIILAITGFFFIMGLLLVVVKAFFTYIAGYMGVALMIIISPLMIPLVLFNATTKIYFDKWLKLLISFTLQPVIMLVFLTFSLAAMDFAVFSGNYSIFYRIAGEASRTQGFSLNEYLTAPRDASGTRVDKADADNRAIIAPKARTLLEVKADSARPIPITKRTVGGMVDSAESKCGKDDIKADPALKAICDATQPILVKLQSVDWEKMAAAREIEGGDPVTISDDATSKGQQISREVLTSVLFCAIVAFVMNGLLGMIPLLAHDMLGDANQSPDIGSAITKNIGGVGGMAGGIISKLRGAIS